MVYKPPPKGKRNPVQPPGRETRRASGLGKPRPGSGPTTRPRPVSPQPRDGSIVVGGRVSTGGPGGYHPRFTAPPGAGDRIGMPKGKPGTTPRPKSKHVPLGNKAGTPIARPGGGGKYKPPKPRA